MLSAFTWSPDAMWVLLQKAWWFLVVLGVLVVAHAVRLRPMDVSSHIDRTRGRASRGPTRLRRVASDAAHSSSLSRAAPVRVIPGRSRVVCTGPCDRPGFQP